MDSPQGPQGPHQPNPTSWLYMQHLLQQLQDHQQPASQHPQQPHHQQPPQPHQQQQQQPPPPPPPHQQHHPLRQPPPHPQQQQQQQQQQQPPPPPHTPPHHLNPLHHHHHQSLPQHHQPLQMQQMSSPQQQYQHPQQQQQHQYKPPPPQQQQQQQQQQQYKPPPPPPQQQQQQQQQYKPPQPQQQQSSKSYLRPDDHSYSVESLLGNTRVELSQPPLLPTPVHPTALLPTPSYPPPLMPTPVLPAPLLPPVPPKIQPDNEMMVMSFLNELEGGKKVLGGGSGAPPTTLHKPLVGTPTSSFSQVLARDDQALRGHPPILSHPGPHLTPTTLHLGLPGDTRIPTTATTPTRVNHNGDTPGLPVSMPLAVPLTHQASPPHHNTVPATTASTTSVSHIGDTPTLPLRMPPAAPLLHEASPPQEPMSLNPVYPGSCEGGGEGNGAAMGRLERGDSASSMSQLDLALSDDSNPLIDQLESALESDSSIQAKASPEGPVPADTSCSDGAREEGEAGKESPTHPQTDMFMSLLNNPPSDASRHSPLHSQPAAQPSPPSQATNAMHTDTQEQDGMPGTLRRPSQDQDKSVQPDTSEKVPEVCSPGTPLPGTTKEDAGGSPIVAQIVPLCGPRKPAQDTQQDVPKATPVVVHVTSLSGGQGSPQDTQGEEEEVQASPQDTQGEEDHASPTDAKMDVAAPSDNTANSHTPPRSPEEVSLVSPAMSPAPDTPPREASPPKDTPESSQDTELVGETISEDSVQAITDIQAPSKDSESKQSSVQDSTTNDTSGPSKEGPLSPPVVLVPDTASEENENTNEDVITPLPEIPTVYIVEPKPEPVTPSKRLPNIVNVTTEATVESDGQQTAVLDEESEKQDKEEVREVVPAKENKQAVSGSQLELRTKKVIVIRKETHFFEPTVVPPEQQKLMVMCYVCDSNVKVSKFKHHLFFGFVRCHYCNRRLMGCRLLKEDLNNPDKSVCFSSPIKVHSFSKWAGDPIEHLSYYIRKDLVIKRFCAGKTKPPPVPEIVAEIHSYITKLSVLESIGPWCYAFERCHKYIQERINAEPKAFDQELRSSVSASLAAHSARLGPSAPPFSNSSTNTPPLARTPPVERTATPPSAPITQQPISRLAEEEESRALPIIQAVTSQKQLGESVVVMEPPVTQSEESVDDPMETNDDPMDAHDDHLSDVPEDAPPSPKDATSTGTPAHTVKVCTFTSLSQPEVPHKSPKPAEEPSEIPSRATPPPKAVPINQTISRLQDILSGAMDTSRKSSPSYSTRTSKTATPEPTPASQSEVESVDNARITTTTTRTTANAVTKKSIAGTTLIRQWGTKAKVHTPAVRRSTQGESWPVRNENYLIIKYPTEACPDLCPSCYTAFDPMQATVQCSSFLMTVRCESCKLTLFVSQDLPPSRPRKKRRL